jgi:hypothetical protein
LNESFEALVDFASSTGNETKHDIVVRTSNQQVSRLWEKIGCQALQQHIFGNIFIEWRTMEFSEFRIPLNSLVLYWF